MRTEKRKWGREEGKKRKERRTKEREREGKGKEAKTSPKLPENPKKVFRMQSRLQIAQNAKSKKKGKKKPKGLQNFGLYNYGNGDRCFRDDTDVIPL